MGQRHAFRVMASAGRPSTPYGAATGKGMDGGPSAAMTTSADRRSQSGVSTYLRWLLSSFGVVASAVKTIG